MNKKLAALVFAVFGAFMVEVSAAGVAEFHTAKGPDCAACHADGKPSSSNVSEAACQKCHGEEPAGKALEIDGKRVANIHKTYFDTFECLQCHKGHSQSVIACAECHKGAQSIQVP